MTDAVRVQSPAIRVDETAGGHLGRSSPSPGRTSTSPGSRPPAARLSIRAAVTARRVRWPASG